jgi:hypothetical protein
VLLRLGRPGAPPAVGRLLVVGLVAPRSRNRVPPPDLLATHRVVRGDVAPDSIFAAGNADDDIVADDEWRVGNAVARGGVGHFLVPQHLPVFRVERYQVGIEGPHVDVGSAVQSDAPIVRPAAIDRGAQLVLVPPELLVVAEVIRHCGVVRGGHVHHAVAHDRRVLERTELGDAGLKDHSGDQLRHICRGDRLELGIPLIEIVAAISRPVARLGSNGAGDTQEHGGNPPTGTGPHGYAPQGLSLMRVALPPTGRPGPIRVPMGPLGWGIKQS